MPAPTPPDVTTSVDAILGPLAGRFGQLLSDLWDTAAPWLTLVVAVRLVLWWLSWRARGKTPGEGGE